VTSGQVASSTGQPARLGLGLLHRARDAMRAEDRYGAGRHLIQLFDEDRALGAQRLDDVAIMDDLVPDIDRRAHAIERTIDDVDRTHDPRAEAARLGENQSDGLFIHNVYGNLAVMIFSSHSQNALRNIIIPIGFIRLSWTNSR
jgi:hypothetical protein